MSSKDLYVGATIMLSIASGRTKLAEPYPFAVEDIPVAAKVISEYDNYWLIEIQPHKNPNGWGTSRPYLVTLDKFDIKTSTFSVAVI